MIRDTKVCLESWADELLSRASRVRNLIGDAHWLSDGHHKENIVREYLTRHLPPSLLVSRGFVCSTDKGTRVSPEIDVLITDRESELPWFSEGGLAIVPPNAVRGQLHVKTEFGAIEIFDVLDSVFQTAESCEPSRDPSELWSGAVFFAHSECTSSEAYAKRLSATLTNYLGGYADIRRKRYLPDCLAVVDGPVITIEKERRIGEPAIPLTVRMFDCGKLSVAILLSNFYDSFIDRGRSMRKRGEWTQLLQQFDYTLILEQKLKSDE